MSNHWRTPHRTSASAWQRIQQLTGWPFSGWATLFMAIGPVLIWAAGHVYGCTVVSLGDMICRQGWCV